MNMENGQQIVVVVHDGIREVFYFIQDADEPLAVVTLSDQESRQLGAIIGGPLTSRGHWISLKQQYQA